MDARELRIGNLVFDNSKNQQLGLIDAIFGIDVLLLFCFNW